MLLKELTAGCVRLGGRAAFPHSISLFNRAKEKVTFVRSKQNKTSDRTFHNVRASKSLDRRILCSSENLSPLILRIWHWGYERSGRGGGCTKILTGIDKYKCTG